MAWQTTQRFCSTLAFSRTLQGLGSSFQCSATWDCTIEDASQQEKIARYSANPFIYLIPLPVFAWQSQILSKDSSVFSGSPKMTDTILSLVNFVSYIISLDLELCSTNFNQLFYQGQAGQLNSIRARQLSKLQCIAMSAIAEFLPPWLEHSDMMFTRHCLAAAASWEVLYNIFKCCIAKEVWYITSI